MRALIVLALSIGIVDSISPSTVAPALYLATARDAQRQLAVYTLGVFAVTLSAGLALALGPGQLLLAAVPHPGPRAKHVIELAIGGLAAAAAAALWRGRGRIGRSIRESEARLDRSSLALGAALAALKLPTSLPYFAVIAAVIGAGISVSKQIVVLVLFNVTFVVPLLALLVLRPLAGPSADERLAQIRDAVHKRAPAAIPLVVLAVAVTLVALGVLGLAHG
jgi:cytochrome c biogenesis protein CcdA